MLQSSHKNRRRPSFLGMGLALLSGICFAILALFAKLANTVPAFEIAFIRSFFSTLFITPLLLYFVDGPVFGPRDQRGWLCARAITGVLGMSFSLYSVKHMPIGDSTVLIFTSPVITGIISRLTLKEPWGWFQAVASLVSLAGVVFIAQPAFLFHHQNDTTGQSLTTAPSAATFQLVNATTTMLKVTSSLPRRTLAFLAGILASFLFSCAYVMGRNLGQNSVHFLTIGFYFSLIGLPSCGVISVGMEEVIPFWDFQMGTSCYMLAIGVVGLIAFSSLNKALALESAPLVALMRNVNVVLAYIFQVLLFSEALSIYSGVGTFLVLSATVSIALQKYFAKD